MRGADDESLQFKADLHAAAERAGMKVAEVLDDTVVVEFRGARTSLGLRPLRLRWRALPQEKRENLLFDLLTAPTSDLFSAAGATFHEVREALLPRIGPPDLRFEFGGSFSPPSRPFVDGVLHVYAVVDEPASMWFVTQGHLDRWGKSMEEVATTALENLRRRTRVEHIEHDAELGVSQYASFDSYDASRVLLFGEGPWAGATRGFIAAVPTKDHLFFRALDQADVRSASEALLRIIWKIFPQAPYPATDRLLWFDGHKWWALGWTKEGDHVEIHAPSEFLDRMKLEGPLP